MLLPYLSSLTERRFHKSKLEFIFTAVLIFPFITQIVFAVGLTGWLSFRSGQQSVNKVATELRNEIVSHISDRLKQYLEEPHKINQLNADAARLGQMDFADLRSMELRFWRQIQLFDSLSSIGFGSKNGDYVTGDRRGTTFRLGRKDKSSPQGALHVYETDSEGNPILLSHKGNPNYDPRLRPWYERGKSNPKGAWTDIFQYSAQPIYAISAVRAIYDRGGEFQGVMISDLMLSEIDRFLEALKIGTSGETFIMERTGNLVASSTTQFPFELVDGKPVRVAAKDSDSPLIRATSEYLTQNFDNLEAIEKDRQLEFFLDGKRQFIEVMPYMDSRGLDWLIVVAIPEADFMEQIEQSTRNTIFLCALALFLAIFVGSIAARWLVKPIVRLSAAATALAEGNWDRTVPIEREDEIGVLAAAFNRMAERLKTSLADLEQEKANLAEAQKIARMGSWEWDLFSNKITWSEQLFCIFGIEPKQTAPDYGEMLEAIHYEDVELFKHAVDRAINEGEAFEIDYRIVRPDARERFVATKGQPKRDETGRVYQIVGTVADITERKQVEIERALILKREQIAREFAETANRLKDEFLAVLSHELRTPLNPILGWTQMLRSKKLDEENVAKGLATIERNVHLQIQLIDDLLDVSRIIQGKLLLQEVPVDLGVIINAALETVRLSIAAKSIILKTVLQPNVGLVKGDPNRLQQVIGNLLSNAVKFTPHGGSIEINLEKADEMAIVRIKDTGKGIAPDFLPYVFDHFRQENSTTTRTFGGLGLGLAIARNLVEMHGGTLKAESQGLGMGATFTVNLPSILVDLASTRIISPKPKECRLDGVKILAVDDEADNLEFLKLLLEAYGAKVIAVSNGQKALEVLSEFLPDILLSDIGMPEMDGYELISLIRALPAERGGRVVSIAITAYATQGDRQRILDAGYRDCITKPLEASRAIETIVSATEIGNRCTAV